MPFQGRRYYTHFIECKMKVWETKRYAQGHTVYADQKELLSTINTDEKN